MHEQNFLHTYETLKEMVEARFRTLLLPSEPDSLYDAVRYLLEASGKRVRPVLVMLSCEAAGGKREEALDAAIATEMVHNFTLVHDDIMDNASQRRGRATVHTTWNENTAILTGDVVLAHAYNLLLRSLPRNSNGVLKAFTQGVIDVCEGQSYDMEFEQRDAVSMKEYLHMVEMKTARLLEMCVEVGARIGGAEEDTIRSLREYARHVGIAFQIQDDLLDVVADEQEFGKTPGGDIAKRKKTFLLVDTLERVPSLSDSEKKIITSLANARDQTPIDIESVKKIYERTGATDNARRAVSEHIVQAKACLDSLAQSDARAMLVGLSEMLGTRKF